MKKTPDREKVIKGLECLITNEVPCDGCPYNEGENSSCLRNIANDALELLKEQKPVRAVADGEDSYRCNNCGTVIGWAEWEPVGIEEVKYKFCPECGRSVKWDA